MSKDWIYDNVLLAASALILLLTTLIRGSFPHFSSDEIETLYILWLLMGIIKSIEREGFFHKLTTWMEKKPKFATNIVMGTFFLAAIATNDVALISVLPLISKYGQNFEELAVLSLLAANIGSALTPIGNPQNLYIYVYYRLNFLDFINAIYALPIMFLPILYLLSLRLNPKTPRSGHSPFPGIPTWAPSLSILIVLLYVLRILPIHFTVLAIVLIAAHDFKSFLKVDYALIATFAAFFLIVDNIEAIVSFQFIKEHGVFLTAALLSQVLSNVPTAILMAPYTDRWRALLWGTNVGGFGTPISSFANLIVFRFVINSRKNGDVKKFLSVYILYEILVILISGATFWLLYGT